MSDFASLMRRADTLRCLDSDPIRSEAYWGAQGATLKPYWYSKPGRPEAMQGGKLGGEKK